MPPKRKQKQSAEAESSGVEVRPGRAARYEDGIAVRTPNAPAQTAGSDDGHSADSTKETD
jgi:hypothetical protein